MLPRRSRNSAVARRLPRVFAPAGEAGAAERLCYDAIIQPSIWRAAQLLLVTVRVILTGNGYIPLTLAAVRNVMKPYSESGLTFSTPPMIIGQNTRWLLEHRPHPCKGSAKKHRFTVNDVLYVLPHRRRALANRQRPRPFGKIRC